MNRSRYRRRAGRRKGRGPLFKAIVNEYDYAHANPVMAQHQGALDNLASAAMNVLDSNSAVGDETAEQTTQWTHTGPERNGSVTSTIVELPDEDDSPSDGDEITVLWDRRKENLLPLAIQPKPDDVLLSCFDHVHRCPECLRSKDVNAMVLCNNCRSFQCRDCFMKGCCVNQSATNLACINSDRETMVEVETCNYAITSTESVKAILGGMEWAVDIQYLSPHENAV